MKLLFIPDVIIASVTKPLLPLFAIVSMQLPRTSFAQSSEFIHHENGLIYSPKTIGQLKYIVDSLNLKFKVCNADPVYFAKAQTIGHFVSLRGAACKALKKDMEQGKTLAELRNKYKDLNIVENICVIRYRDTNPAGKDFIGFRSIGMNAHAEQHLSFHSGLNKYEGALAGKWVVDYEPRSYGFPRELEAFFITREFEAPRIPQQYARWIQYADCLVDTTAQIFSEAALKRGGWRFPDEKRAPYMNEFETYLNKCSSNKEGDTILLSGADESKLRLLAEAAYTEAMKTGNSSSALETYFEKHGAPDRALALKRNRIVVGSCSQDTRPRNHALNIARLSAETVKWEIFLRAHLDIMNDKFERASDGSYAWGERQTYLKELEVLDIQVADLLLGISLRISNPAANHYDGYIGRVGRALAEYKDPDGIEQMMEQVISDEKVDLYNRTLMYYLFLNYNHYLKDEARKKENMARIDRVKEGLVKKLVNTDVGNASR
ncbi:MAG: hypothetical protein DI535_14235 [Citrobacter freundii]|nr:MAG: hypothetical protein DI535_14235 [Citrobacter freundii]